MAESPIPSPFKIRIKILYFPGTIKDIKKLLSHSDNISPMGTEGSSYLFSDIIGRQHRRQISLPFTFFRFSGFSNSEHILAFITISNREEWKKGILRFIKKQYPELVPILLSQSELIKGVKLLSNKSDEEIHVKAFSAKESVEGLFHTKRQSVRKWTDQELEDVIESVRQRRQTITSIDIGFYPRINDHVHINPKATCKITKQSEIEVTGSFNTIYNSVVRHVAKLGASKLHTYSGRGLKESSYNTKPLSINYKTNVFKEVGVIKEFIGTIEEYPHSIYSIEHGNPYAQLRVTDLHDGSSFSVYAIPPKRVVIIPGLKASEAAFERILHYVFDEFWEGEITEYERDGRSFKAITK